MEGAARASARAGLRPTSAPQSRTAARRRERRCGAACVRTAVGGVGGIGGAAEWRRQPEAKRRAAARGKAWGLARPRASRAPSRQPRRESRRAVAPQEGFPPCRIPCLKGGRPERGVQGGKPGGGKQHCPAPERFATVRGVVGAARRVREEAALRGDRSGEAVGRTPLIWAAGASRRRDAARGCWPCGLCGDGPVRRDGDAEQHALAGGLARRLKRAGRSSAERKRNPASAP